MFKKVGVIGAGQMGSGIAQVCIASGFEVLLSDVDEKILKSATEKIEKGINKMAEKKFIQESPSDVMKRLKTTTSLSSFEDREFIIEAAVENYDVKAEIFRKLNSILQKDAILSTNTSSISITKLASNTNRPEKVIGVHFMNPVPLMKLVEIVKGIRTSEETLKTSLEFVQKLGKEAIISKDSPGFVVNRVLFGMLSEAARLLEEGVASIEDIDKGMKLGTNHPMGPFELMDLIGLDTCLFILNVLYEEFGDPRYKAPVLLKRMVEAGYLGKKSGRGFYKYGG
jgi:3-hydroxybutyryl-CoA dehydrogenase